MKVTVEIDPAEIQQIVYELAAEQVRETLKREICDRLRENDNFWDLVDEAIGVYLNSESFNQLIRRTLHSSEDDLIKVIRERILEI
jgi:hypothetical protein